MTMSSSTANGAYVTVGQAPLPPAPKPFVLPTISPIWRAVGLAGGAAGAYHGYKRTGSVGWAILWSFWGSFGAPLAVPIMLAQGFGKKKAP
jgi:hypothetical protein